MERSIEIRIMAVRERREKYILPMLKQLGMSEDIVFYDEPGKKKIAMRNARKTWLAPTQSEYVCVLQDDIQLCNNFVEILNKCACNFPHSIFSFFQPRLRWEDKDSETPYIKITGCGMYGPAILMPAYMIKDIFYWGDKVYGEDFKHDDTVIGFFAKVHNIPVMSTIPCLIQHLGHNDSILGYNNKNKVSKVFCVDIDLAQFDTKKYKKSKSIPNTVFLPDGGYKTGKLIPITELK